MRPALKPDELLRLIDVLNPTTARAADAHHPFRL